MAKIQSALAAYAEVIGPWATTVGRYMLADVNRRNEQAWQEHGADIARGLRREIATAPTGQAFRVLLADQVDLIKSLPLKEAERVHAMVQEGMFFSTRSTTLAKQLLETSNVPIWRAKLIARTEVSRATVTLTQVRAQSIGSEGYIWRTSGDGDVRETHKEQDGKYIRWDSPPKTDKGLAPYHAGCGPNCRCYPDPVLPDL